VDGGKKKEGKSKLGTKILVFKFRTRYMPLQRPNQKQVYMIR
jgi:hypothetical protein